MQLFQLYSNEATFDLVNIENTHKLSYLICFRGEFYLGTDFVYRVGKKEHSLICEWDVANQK
jgi:hypothetical protein